MNMMPHNGSHCVILAVKTEPQMKPKAAQYLDESEVNRLLYFFKKNKLWAYFIYVKLSIYFALRFKDISNLVWADVLGKSRILINESKTSKAREIPISQELQDSIRLTYIELGSPSIFDKIVPIGIRGVNKQLKVYSQKCGIKKRVSTHTWRKTFGREVWSRNGKSDASLLKLSMLFNHSSTTITRIYLDITREEVLQLYKVDDLFQH